MTRKVKANEALGCLDSGRSCRRYMAGLGSDMTYHNSQFVVAHHRWASGNCGTRGLVGTVGTSMELCDFCSM